jgi:predicted TIM-barrel fold metal-dependent hydrolase
MEPGTQEWLDQVVEAPLDAEREIVDPHHHLWPPHGPLAYGVDDLVADTTSGHRIVETVFIECSAGYRPDGPEHLRPVGETEFVAASAADLAARYPSAPPIAGIVAHADLAHTRLDETLDAHEAASGGRFRGIRDSIANALDPDAHMIPGRYGAEKSASEAFRAGIRRLGERGLSYDCWMFHHQISEFADMARAAPDTTMVFDHFGTPLGVGRFESGHDDYFDQWKADVAAVAAQPNTVAKLGGLAMPDNGFGYHTAGSPPTSEQLVADQQRWYEHTIECFGPERCMFESNFPVDRFSLSYTVYWNAMQRIASSYSETEQDAMFAGTARRVYRLGSLAS